MKGSVAALGVLGLAFGAFLLFAGDGAGPSDVGGRAPEDVGHGGPHPMTLALEPAPESTLTTPPPAADTTGPAKAGEATGSVRVVVSSKGAPLAGAAVRLAGTAEDAAVRTDAGGVAVLADVAAGSTAVRVDAQLHAGETRWVDVAAAVEASVTFDLAPGVPVDGTVVDAESGLGIPRASVEAGASGALGRFGWLSARSPYGVTETDGRGRFHVNGIPEKEIATVTARAPGYAAGGGSVRILEGKPIPSPFEIRLARAGRVEGRVTESDGKPVPRATVFVVPASDELLRADPHASVMSSGDATYRTALRATADGDGSYVVDGVPLEDDYVAWAEVSDRAPSPQVEPVSVRKGTDRVRVDHVLPPPSTVTVRLVDEQGRPVTAALALTWKGRPDRLEGTADGAHQFRTLPPGTHPFLVECDGFLPARGSVTVEPGKDVSVTIPVDRGASVSGRVEDESGKPVASARVTVAPTSENPAPGEDTRWLSQGRDAVTDGSGTFRVDGLQPGDVLAIAWWNGDSRARRTLRPVGARAPATDVRVVVTRVGSVTLRLLTPDGTPYAGRVFRWWGLGEVDRGGSDHTEDGRLLFDDLDAGEHAIDVVPDGYAPVRRRVVVRLRETVDLGDVPLERGLTLDGRVVAADRRPIAGARVSVADDDETSTDEHGRFTVPNLLAERMRVAAQAEGYLAESTDVEVRPGMPPVVIALSRGALLRARVLDREGEPAAERAVTIGRGGSPHGVPPVTDRLGRFETRVRAGTWRLTLLDDSGPIDLGELTLAEGETRDLVLRPVAR